MGEEISITHRKIVAIYKYNHVPDTESIRKILRILATTDAALDRRKSKAPGELADMVSQGMTRLKQMVQQHPHPLHINRELSLSLSNWYGGGGDWCCTIC